MAARFPELEMQVERWDAHGFEVISASRNVLIAQGAFDAAVRELELRPGEFLLLRHGARVIQEHPPRPRVERAPDPSGYGPMKGKYRNKRYRPKE